VFVGVKAVNFNVADAYSSTASWTLAAYDLSTRYRALACFSAQPVYDSLHDIGVSPDGNTVVATGGAYDGFPVGATDSRIVTVAYDSATGAERWSQTWDGNQVESTTATSSAFSPDGRSVYIEGLRLPRLVILTTSRSPMTRLMERSSGSASTAGWEPRH